MWWSQNSLRVLLAVAVLGLAAAIGAIAIWVYRLASAGYDARVVVILVACAITAGGISLMIIVIDRRLRQFSN